ncbi:DUF6325 family protein [Salininema proteolyticum]|uniref:DUF6325 family protein n=1 Tax=Salininema proteolyticum TaxID=1607685 RepID=A0ABV8U4U0_9ACTN
MGDRAPVDIILVRFPGTSFDGEVVASLRSLAVEGTITVIDAMVIRKEADGSWEWNEAAEAGDGALASVVREPTGMLAEEDAEELAAELEPDSTVGVLLFEHTWASGLAGAIRRAKGEVVDWERVPPAAVDELEKLND